MASEDDQIGIMSDVNVEAPYNPEDENITELTENEVDMIERLVWAEAGTESEEGRNAVRGVILNRLSSDRFPNSVEDVINQRGQFEPIGKYGSVDAIPVPDEDLETGKYEFYEYLNVGEDASGGRTFFLNKNIAKKRGTDFSGEKPLTIGRHTFYSGFPGQEPVRVSPMSHNVTIVDSRPGTVEELSSGLASPVVTEDDVAPASDEEVAVASSASPNAAPSYTPDTAATPSPRISNATDDAVSQFTTRDRSSVDNQTQSAFGIEGAGTSQNYNSEVGRVETSILQSVRDALGLANGGMAVEGNQEIEEDQPLGDGSVVMPYEPTLREKAKYKIGEFISSLTGMDDRGAIDMAERFTGNPNATDGSYGIGLADFTPAGLVFGGEEAKDSFERARNTDDKLGMGLAVVEGGLSAIEAFPLTKLAAKGAKKGLDTLADIAENMDPNTVGSMGGNAFSKKKMAQEPVTPDSVETLAEEVYVAPKPSNTNFKNTVKAYKLFRIDPNRPGELFPLYVDSKTGVTVGEWIDAISGEIDPKTGKVMSSIGNLAYRPGWHAGDLPLATHIGPTHKITAQQAADLQARGANNVFSKKNRKTGEIEYFERLRAEDTVWAEVEMPADVDWQSVADSNARIMKNGQPESKTAHITDQIPFGGFYRYKTNPNMTGEWLISGNMKVNRVLTDDEVASINKAAGVYGDMPRTPYTQSQPETVPAQVATQTEEAFELAGGPNNRVDTRLPAETVRDDNLQTGSMISDTDALMSGNTKMDQNFAMMAENYPGLKNLWSEDVAETAANVKGQMTDNIVSLYDMSDKLGIAEDSAQWYRGANRIANGLAQRFGILPEKTSGVLAVMSPQKDWFQNVALAERLIKHHTELGPNAPWTQAMDDVTTTVPASRKKKGNTAFQDGKNGAVLEQIKGKSWGDLETPEQKAMWLRAYDEAHFGKNYREISPEGDILGYSVSKSGEPASLVHQGFGDIAKAVRILEGDGSIKAISPELGGNHKVRNFFNNIYNPDSPVDVTVDTHQIAAGLLRPLGSSAVEVTHGLNGANVKGNPARWSNDGKADSGMAGSYGLYFDATVDAAKLRDVLPREMQSISWEQLRTLFPQTLKNNKSFIQSTEAIWRMVDDKQLTPDGARNMIIAEAEKLGAGGAPSWKTYAGAVRDIGVPTAGLIGAAGLATAEEAPEEFSKGGLTEGESEKGIRTVEGKEMADNVFKLDFSKADLNDDGRLSAYEKARGEAVQKAIEEDGIMKAAHGGMPCGCGGECDGSCGEGSMPGMIVGTDPVSGNEIPLGSDAENVRDDIPAMLSQGEYVLPADVVKWHGLKHISEMMMEAKAGLMSLHAMGQIHEVEEFYYDEEPYGEGIEDAEISDEDYYAEEGEGELQEEYETPEGNEVEIAEVITEEETPEYDEEEETVETMSYAMKSTPKIAFIR